MAYLNGKRVGINAHVICDTDASYAAGYTAGYNEGEAEGYTTGHAMGYNQGEAAGYTEGQKSMAVKAMAEGNPTVLDCVHPTEHELGITLGKKNYIYQTVDRDSGRAGLTLEYDVSDDTYTINGTVEVIGDMILTGGFYLPVTTQTQRLAVEVVSGTATRVGGNFAFSVFKNVGSQQYWSNRIIFDGNIDLPQIVESAPAAGFGGYECKLMLQTWGVGTVFDNLKVRVYTDYTNASGYAPYIADLNEITVTRCGSNLLPYPYHHKTRTDGGITFTDNGDGTVTANGTATADAVYITCYEYINPLLVVGEKYYVSGCPAGGSVGTYYLEEGWTGGRDTGNGFNTIMANTNYFKTIRIRIKAGMVCDNLVFKPMLTREPVSYADWTPFISQTATANADGIVDGLMSVSPITTLAADEGVTINAEYWLDAERKLNEMETAILDLGGSL